MLVTRGEDWWGLAPEHRAASLRRSNTGQQHCVGCGVVCGWCAPPYPPSSPTLPHCTAKEPTEIHGAVRYQRCGAGHCRRGCRRRPASGTEPASLSSTGGGGCSHAAQPGAAWLPAQHCLHPHRRPGHAPRPARLHGLGCCFTTLRRCEGLQLNIIFALFLVFNHHRPGQHGGTACADEGAHRGRRPLCQRQEWVGKRGGSPCNQHFRFSFRQPFRIRTWKIKNQPSCHAHLLPLAH